MKRIVDQIQSEVRGKNYKALKKRLAKLHPADVVEVLEELKERERVSVFRLLKKDAAAEVFVEMGGKKRLELVKLINKELLDDILEEMHFDDKIDFLEEMPANFVKTVLADESSKDRQLINKFLNYPDDSAGSLMTIEFMELEAKWTVKEALAYIKKTGKEKVIANCYVLDETRVLEGAVGLANLVLANEKKLVEEVMVKDVIYGLATEDQESIVQKLQKYNITSLPIVDGEKRLIGVVTVDDIVDVMEEEATEDMQRMAAMAPSDEAYLDTGVWSLTKKRVVWLLILMIGGTLTGSIIAYYEELLGAVVILMAAIPLLMDSGGNAGSQSATLVIRGLAVGEIKISDWWRVLWKEMRVSMIAGGILAVVNMIRMLLLQTADIMVCLTVSLTLMLTIMMAKMVGAVLPLGAKFFKIDPAVMASPMITTIVDAVALLVYFGLAKMLVL
ncbi:magnesium transporter [Microgenomates group bacterium]|nr:magnesium transporter [Microgenomates group bacterium]